MNFITELLSGLSTVHYLLLYLCCFVLAMLCVFIGKKTKLEAILPLMAVFGLLGGMIAVAFVTINLKFDMGVWIILVFAAFMSIIVFSSFWFEKKLKKKRAAGKPEQQRVSRVPTESAPQKQPVNPAESTESKDLLDRSKKDILSVIRSPEYHGSVPDLLCQYLEEKGTKTYSKGKAKAIMTCLTEDQVIDLVKNNQIKGQSQWALAEISNNELLKKLSEIDGFSRVATSELRTREYKTKERAEREHCPDGTPHEFGDEFIEYIDMGPKGDDDLAAHDYRDDRCRICKKCGYKLIIR